MKLCKFDDDRLGVVIDRCVHDVTSAQSELRRDADFTAHADPVIAALPRWKDRIERMASYVPGRPISEVRFLAPVAKPPKIVAAPTNYADHVAEMQKLRQTDGRSSTPSRSIEEAGLFLKSNTSLVGPAYGIPIRFPDRRNDHEAEIVVVIGKRGSNIPAGAAMEYVAGYSLGLDITVRGSEDRSFRKSCDGYTVLGPWIVTADEVPEPDNVPFELFVGDDRRQSSSTGSLIFNIPRLIEFASQYYTLYPGDLLFTGTPQGVGPIRPGDQIRVQSLPQFGELRTEVFLRETLSFARTHGPFQRPTSARGE